MGHLLLLVRRSLRQHLLSSVITILATALACGLVMAIFTIESQTRDAFVLRDPGFDAVLGARGSQLQLVLNAVFHLETSPGNIPWSLYRRMHGHPAVELAIPYALGDNYRGFRVVGTTTELFQRFEYREGRRFRLLAPNEVFRTDRKEAVVGSYAAERTGLRRGSTFLPSHGLTPGGMVHDRDVYTVVGVMEPTNTPADRVIWIPIEGIFRMEGHVLRGTQDRQYVAEAGHEIPDEHKEVSAVMLKLGGGPMDGARLAEDINRRGKVATLAWPIGTVMGQLFDKLGWVTTVLRLVAYLVVAVAIGSILASIYNTMNERRREFAILRALGAQRGTVFSVIVAEAAAIAACGAVVGFAVHFIVVAAAAFLVRKQTGVVIDPFELHPVLVVAPLGMVLLGAAAGVLPALKAYATDVADNLVPQS
jgi:putative ABC transport system permease protein